MKFKVLFHDSCFDGASSAAVFSRFYRERVNPKVEFSYQGLAHKAGGSAIDPALLDGDENAIVDFRYSQSPQLTWWFDHHVSAFQQPGDEAHFRADTSGHKFHDGTAKSCTKFLADIASSHFGFDARPLSDLIAWADLIDGAQFPNPGMAVRLEQPALKLMMVIEANQDPAFMPRLIADLQTKTLDQIAAEPYVAEPLQPLFARHQLTIEQVRRRATVDREVVFFDLTEDKVENLNKFIAYDLFPEARYTVNVTQSGARSKVSLGSNPWARPAKAHNLARIAEKFGGGGHPVVAAISFKPDEVERAKTVAREIAETLRNPPAEA